MAAAVIVLLAACGGGGSDGSSNPAPAQPTIASFSANKAAYPMGERAQLTPVFSGGRGRIEPEIGAVQSGVPVTTPMLDGDVTYRLVVESVGQPAATRTLSLPVNHRDRYLDVGPFASMFHSAVELPDGGVLIVGGWRGGSVNSDAIDRFDPVTQTFARLGEMTTGRAQARLVVLGDGKVLIAGGATSVASGVTYELLDPQTGQVSPAGVPVRNRLGHTATRLLDGRVFIAGGLEQNTAEIWDPATRSARPAFFSARHSLSGSRPFRASRMPPRSTCRSPPCAATSCGSSGTGSWSRRSCSRCSWRRSRAAPTITRSPRKA
jgi:hypothetical protein